jgi:hypothetical protein
VWCVYSLQPSESNGLGWNRARAGKALGSWLLAVATEKISREEKRVIVFFYRYILLQWLGV